MDHEDASRAPTTLESLPDELLEFIAILLPHPDEDRYYAETTNRDTLPSLCLVSRRLYRIAQPVLGRFVSILNKADLLRIKDPTHKSLRNLEFSFVIVDLWNPGCLSQLTALAFSLVMFKAGNLSHFLSPTFLPSLRRLHLVSLFEGPLAFRRPLFPASFAISSQLEMLQLSQPQYHLHVPPPGLLPCPILVKASAIDWTPPPPHDLQRMPISHLELYGAVGTRDFPQHARSIQSLCAGLRTVCAFITGSRTSSHPLLSLTVPHIYQAIDAPVQLRDAANAVATLCRTEGVVLRFVTHRRFGSLEPRFTQDFGRWWARVQAERAG
ncbi:hypothetical protein JCM3770_000585 [Rhodotorula araucariae]